MISALDFEYEYVHTAYEQLAFHLQPIVPKRWPFVDEFLKDFPAGSLLADVGCGEGKYLTQSSASFLVGCDRSASLSSIACSRGNEIATCDITHMPFRDATFDGIICISVIHHLATETRRIKALKELSRLLRPGGKILITGWALENKYRKFNCQDVLVPAELLKNTSPKDTQQETASHATSANKAKEPKSLGYIHHHASRLATKLGSLHSIISQEVESLKSKINAASNVTDTIHHYVVHRKRSLWLWVEDRTLLSKLGHIFRTRVRKTRSNNDLSSLQQQQQQHTQCKLQTTTTSTTGNEEEEDQANSSIHRYYHVFQKGELSKLIDDNVPRLEVHVESFTQGNWVLAAKKL